MHNARRVVIKRLAVSFLERADALGLKGKRADSAALEYFIGACALAQAQGDTAMYEHLGRLVGMVICLRGVFAVRELVAEKIPAG
jgi:hypothetical protein